VSHNSEIAPIFASCFRLLAKLSATVDDGFFIDLLDQESEKLLRSYIIFLKHEGSGEIVRQSNYVAQSHTPFIYQIKNIFTLIVILEHLGFTETTTPLLLRRDLLLLELAILNHQLEKRINSGVGKPNRKSEKNQTNVGTPSDFSSQTHKQITEFVYGRKRVQNTEVFSGFPGIAPRTLKRKLSELIKTGAIKRVTEGKKVFYISNGIDGSSELAKINME